MTIKRTTGVSAILAHSKILSQKYFLQRKSPLVFWWRRPIRNRKCAGSNPAGASFNFCRCWLIRPFVHFIIIIIINIIITTTTNNNNHNKHSNNHNNKNNSSTFSPIIRSMNSSMNNSINLYSNNILSINLLTNNMISINQWIN